MPSKIQSLILRAPGIFGLNTEGEQVQAQPQYARVADNVAYDSAGRLGNRKGFTSTSAKFALTLGSNPITTDSASDAADTDGIAVAAKPDTTFSLVSDSLPPTAPRFLSATTAGSSDGSKTVTITGTDVTDTIVTETLTLAGSASTVNGSQLFKTVTSAVISAQPSGNVEIGVQASTELTIAHTGHSRLVGDTVTFSGASATDGIDASVINASHTLTTVVDANSYKIVVLDTVSSGSTAGGGSSVVAKFVGLQGYPDIEQLFQFNNSSGNKLIATATVSSTRKIFKLDAPYSDFEDVTGSTSPAGNDWQFVNFNDKVIGARSSNTLIAYSGSSTFANITSAVKDLTIPTSDVNVDDNTITFTNHGYFTGEIVKYENSGGTTLAGLTDGNIFYVIRVDDNTLKLATSFANAAAGTEVDLTGTGNDSQKLEAVKGAGTVPTGNCVHSGFGRLWAQKSHSGIGKNIIAYSALLDETSWTTGGGEINVLGNAGSVSTGFDELVAISSFDGFLVAFLRDSIIIYDSPEAPANLSIEQVIKGIGCIARDSVQQVGDDIYFLSSTGIRSLKQVVFTTNRVELTEISQVVRKDLVDSMNTPTGNLSKIRTCYNPEEGQYWIKAPNGDIFSIHNYSLIDKDTPRITKFTETDWFSFVYFEGETFLAQKGNIGKYQGFNDIDPTTSPPALTTYTSRWASNYADFDTSKIKMLKNVGVTVFGASNQQLTLDWDFDNGLANSSRTLTIKGAGDLAEFNVAEFNVAEFSGGVALEKIKSSASRTGRTLSIGLFFVSNGNALSVEQISLFAKIGREDK